MPSANWQKILMELIYKEKPWLKEPFQTSTSSSFYKSIVNLIVLTSLHFNLIHACYKQLFKNSYSIKGNEIEVLFVYLTLDFDISQYINNIELTIDL